MLIVVPIRRFSIFLRLFDTQINTNISISSFNKQPWPTVTRHSISDFLWKTEGNDQGTSSARSNAAGREKLDRHEIFASSSFAIYPPRSANCVGADCQEMAERPSERFRRRFQLINSYSPIYFTAKQFANRTLFMCNLAIFYFERVSIRRFIYNCFTENSRIS